MSFIEFESSNTTSSTRASKLVLKPPWNIKGPINNSCSKKGITPRSRLIKLGSPLSFPSLHESHKKEATISSKVLVVQDKSSPPLPSFSSLGFNCRGQTLVSHKRKLSKNIQYVSPFSMYSLRVYIIKLACFPLQDFSKKIKNMEHNT
jgi:hypothetical protein